MESRWWSVDRRPWTVDRLKRWAPLLFALALFVALFVPLLDGLIARQRGRWAAEHGNPAEAARLLEHAARNLPSAPALWEEAGLAAYRAGEHPRAIHLLEEARVRQVLTAEGWDALGLLYWEQNEPSLAIACWQEALAHLGPSARFYMRLALAYRHLENWSKEQEALEKWIEIKGDDAYAHYRLGLLFLTEDPSRAAAELALAASLDPRLVSAETSLSAALSAARAFERQSERHILLGRALGAVEEWKLALRLFERAAQEDPQNGEALAWLAEARQHLGQPLQDELEQAKRLAPRSPTVHLLRGLHALRNGKNAQAVIEFRQASELQPREAAIWIALGEAYAQLGDLPLAFSAYRRATQLAPSNAETWRALAMFCATYGIELDESGLRAARQAVILEPDDPRNLDTLGWLLLLNGDLENAERTLTQALDLSPELASAHLHLATIYLYHGRLQEAQHHLLEVIRLEPESPLAETARRMLGTP